MNALELFGGRQRVVVAMTAAVKEGLGRFRLQEIPLIEHELGLSPETLTGIYAGKAQVSYDLFERICGSLSISIHQILGKPNFEGDAYDRWKREYVESPMFVAGMLGDGNASDAILPFETYVVLRSIEELGDDCSVN